MKLFKRKNKIKALSKEDLQWNKMWELWVEGKIDSPYFELMEYLNGINNGGHECHFDNYNNNGNLQEYVNQLTKILPDILKENLLLAYNIYKKDPDNLSTQDIETLKKCDSIYYKNEELVNEILKKRALEIEI